MLVLGFQVRTGDLAENLPRSPLLVANKLQRDDEMVGQELDRRAGPHHERLVAVLEERGVASEVLDAFAAVARHRFVERFWVGGFAAAAPTATGGLLVDEAAGDDVFELVYAPDSALLTAAPSQATSSVSAPYLIACMLDELDLAPGMRVLEIGAGSGYHAALIAVMVGDPGLVTTIDIDRRIIDQTRRRLADLGLGAISVICADGDDGDLAEARYDRIVATVGCNDLAPAWSEHLAADGVLLVPLVHGSAHPRVKLARSSGRLDGHYPGYSGFVPIQGAQAGNSPWPDCTTARPATQTVRDLPAALATVLATPDESRPYWNPAEWAFGFYLALRDRRASSTMGLLDGRSFAGLEAGRLLLTGTRAEELADDLLAYAHDWLDLAAPGLNRYRTAFVPDGSATPAVTAPSPPSGPWNIRRLRHHQTIELAA